MCSALTLMGECNGGKGWRDDSVLKRTVALAGDLG